MGWRIFHLAGLALCCRSRLNSNVRLRKNQMLCRCFHPMSVNTKTRARTEFKPVFLANSLSEKCMSAPSGPAALTSFGVRGAICGSRLFEMITFASASGFYLSHVQLAHKASSRGGRSTGKATPAHPTSCGVRHPRLCSSLKPPTTGLYSIAPLHRPPSGA